MNDRASGQSHWLLFLAVAAAAALGIYARFKGLGVAPFSVDEYYLGRSTQNVMHAGLPAFPCGGYYTRGLVLQYLGAALRFAGLAPELAPRLIAAICSLLLLPAAYLLGKRSDGPLAGLLTVAILLLSVWEVEMARFGRMYAPFQPVCAWYLVYFVRYCVDRDTRAFRPMLALSILAPFVWEGGALLALLNLVPMFLPQATQRTWPKLDWARFAASVAIFAFAFWFVTADFRGYNAASWPPGFSRSLAFDEPAPLAAFSSPFRQLPHGIYWYVLGAIPLLAVSLAMRWLWQWRHRPIAALGLLAVLLSAVAHQFALAAVVTLLLLLTQHLSWPEVRGVSARPLHWALAACVIFWLVYGITSVDWHVSELHGLRNRLGAFLYPYVSFPDFAGVVAQPWARAVPRLGLGLSLLAAAAVLNQARRDRPVDASRVLAIAFVVLLTAASASHPPRQETRYVFFLYPLAIVLAVTVITRASRLFLKAPPLAAAGAVLMTGSAFAASEDFQPRHLMEIDSPAEIFRQRMSLDMQGHLEIRTDYRSVSDWLRQRVVPGDLVINGVHGLDIYYPRIDYFFADQRDPDFPSWSCQRGTIERWGSYPLIYNVPTLAETVSNSHDTYLIFYPSNNPGLLQSLAPYSPQILWSQGYVYVAVLHGLR